MQNNISNIYIYKVENIDLILEFFLAGVAIGAGWQVLVAFVNLSCYYVVGVPIGALLAYVAGLFVRVRFFAFECNFFFFFLMFTSHIKAYLLNLAAFDLSMSLKWQWLS